MPVCSCNLEMIPYCQTMLHAFHTISFLMACQQLSLIKQKEMVPESGIAANINRSFGIERALECLLNFSTALPLLF